MSRPLKIARHLAALALLFTMGCSNTFTVCAPNLETGCTCENGAPGRQVCNADGTGFGACERCGAVGGPPDGGQGADAAGRDGSHSGTDLSGPSDAITRGDAVMPGDEVSPSDLGGDGGGHDAGTIVECAVDADCNSPALVCSAGLCSCAQGPPCIAEYLLSDSTEAVNGLTVGPDNNIWFTRNAGLGRVTLGGVVTELQGPGAGFIAAGSDGNLWFTEVDKIGRMTVLGQLTEFPVRAMSSPFVITSGPDGALWFTELVPGGSIGRMDVTGAFSEIAVPGAAEPHAITTGPDGNLWFTCTVGVGRLTPAGSATIFFLSGSSPSPSTITVGPDGNLWFVESLGQSQGVGRITTGGTSTSFFVDGVSVGLAAGPDGQIWFTLPASSKLGSITVDGIPTGEVPTPTPNVNPNYLILGPNGTLWFGAEGRVGVLRL